MCEIAVVPADPADSSIEGYLNLAAKLYQQNSHGLGMVAVYDGEAGETDDFQYSYYKTTNPTERWPEIKDWLQSRTHAWRFVFHARLATAGDQTVANTHPLDMEDDDIDTELVVHNGVVHGHRRRRRELEDDGHEFATDVDSEVIAHTHDDLPSSLDDDEFDGTQLHGNLNYLLFGKDGILVRNSGKYTLSEDFRMSCRPVNKQTEAEDELPVDDPSVDDLGNTFALYKPDHSVETTEANRAALGGTGNRRSGARSSGAWGRGYSGTRRPSSGAPDYRDRTSDDEDDAGDGSRSGTTTNEVYTDSDDVEQYRTSATVEWASASIQRDTENYAWDDEDVFTLLGMDSVIRDGNMTFIVKLHDETAVKDARVLIRAGVDGETYEQTGIYKTDETGAVILEQPDSPMLITAELLSVPSREVPDGMLPDERPVDPDADIADDGDDLREGEEAVDDDTDDGSTVIDADEAEKVDWWHLYEADVEDTEMAGYCSLHFEEFSGYACPDCLHYMEREQLLGDDFNDVTDDSGRPIQTARIDEESEYR